MAALSINRIILLAAASAPMFAPMRPAFAREADPPAAVELEKALGAEGACVLDALTGEVLFEKNGDRRLYPASITKILTALIVIESGDLDELMTVEEPETKAEPSKLYIKAGERYPRKQMLYGLMLKSANDVAESLARDNAGSVEAFGVKMTERARELGATDSQFRNPNGLPDKEHYTTARDMALIARAAMSQPAFRQIVSTRTYDWVSATGERKTLTNSNRLLSRFEGCTGLKTGWTNASKHTLASAALRDAREVIAVVLKASSRSALWAESTRLLDYGLKNVPDLPIRDKFTKVDASVQEGAAADPL